MDETSRTAEHLARLRGALRAFSFQLSRAAGFRAGAALSLNPSARDLVPNLAAVPSIRFLTTADFPPFNYRDKTGELVGFNVDLSRAVCADLAITCTIQAWPWEQAGRALEDGQGDALIAGLAMRPENGALFDFTNIYLMLPGRFVMTNDTVAAVRSRHNSRARPSRPVAALRTRRSSPRHLPDVKLSEFDTEIAALEARARRASRRRLGDAMRASFWLNANPDCCSFVGQPYFRPDLFGDGLSVAGWSRARHSAPRHRLQPCPPQAVRRSRRALSALVPGRVLQRRDCCIPARRSRARADASIAEATSPSRSSPSRIISRNRSSSCSSRRSTDATSTAKSICRVVQPLWDAVEHHAEDLVEVRGVLDEVSGPRRRLAEIGVIELGRRRARRFTSRLIISSSRSLTLASALAAITIPHGSGLRGWKGRPWWSSGAESAAYLGSAACLVQSPGH